MAVAPDFLVATHLFQRQVGDREQPALLQVRRGNAPAALEVAIEAIAKDVAQCALRLSQRLVLHARIAGIRARRQVQRIEDLLRQILVVEPLRTCPLGCSEASCRLSVKLNIFGGSGFLGASRKRRIAERLKIVVAVLRPSELSEASLAKSSRCRKP